MPNLQAQSSFSPAAPEGSFLTRFTGLTGFLEEGPAKAPQVKSHLLFTADLRRLLQTKRAATSAQDRRESL